MAKWRTRGEMKAPKNGESDKGLIVKVESGKIYFGHCSFHEGKVHNWFYYRAGFGCVASSESCFKDEGGMVTHWKPLPKPEKLASML